MTARNIICIFIIISLISFSFATEDLLKEYKEYNRGTRNVTAQPMTRCPQTLYQFPNNGISTDYLRVKSAIPHLHEFTICFRLVRYKTEEWQAWISYANIQSPNAFLVGVQGSELSINVLGQASRVTLPITENTENHICIATYASTSGKSYVFLNGNLDYVKHFTPAVIDGRGVLVIGQDQDRIGGAFEGNQAFQGEIFNFMLWNRILDHDEIVDMYQDRCNCSSDSTVTLEAHNVDIFGGVIAMLPETAGVSGC